MRASQAPRPRPPAQIARSGAKRIAAHIQKNVGRQHLTSAHGPFASPSIFFVTAAAVAQLATRTLCAPSSRLSQFSCRHASACDGARTGCPPLTRATAQRPALPPPRQHAKFLRVCDQNMNRRLQKTKRNLRKQSPALLRLDLLGSRFTTRRACSRDVSHAIRRARASRAQSHQGCGGVCIPLRGGEAVPSDGLCSVLPNTFTVLKRVAQVELSLCIPLRCCKAIQSHSLGIVLRNTSALIKRDAQVVLSDCMPLCRCKAVESPGVRARYVFLNVWQRQRCKSWLQHSPS